MTRQEKFGNNSEFNQAVKKIIAKTWKQPKCPSTDEWIKKMWYVYTVQGNTTQP